MWDKMEVFYQVVKAGSFTKAEKILNKSQGALSRSVAILEERLDARLLRRKIKGLELTRKGEEVFRIAQRMFMDMDGLRTNLEDREGIQGKIRIATTSTIAEYVLAEPLVDFHIQYPKTTIEIICNDSTIDIFQREVDVVVRLYDKEEESSLIQKYLFPMKAGLFASSEYLKKNGTPKRIEELDFHKVICRSRPEENPYSDVEWILKVGKQFKEKRCPVFTANSTPNLLIAAKNGVGITTSYANLGIPLKYNLQEVLPEIEAPEYKIYIGFPKKLEKIDRIKTFTEFLLNSLSYLRK